MNENNFICNVCKSSKGKNVNMIKKHDIYTCPQCNTSIIIPDESPIGRFNENWVINSKEIFPLLRPPLYQSDLPNPRLYFLYEDCYYNLLIGRYNASIILMGVLLEAFMKERIALKCGIDFTKPYGPCLNKIEKEKLIEKNDIEYLRKFKNEIRNPYQHSDEKKILEGRFVPVWPMQFNGKFSIEKMEKFMKKVKSKQLKPILLPAAEIPALRSIAKQTYDKNKAIALFNQVYDFILKANIKYLKKEEYDEHHKKFGSKLENINHYNV
jgi:transposase